jgi:hypothetical protein
VYVVPTVEWRDKKERGDLVSTRRGPAPARRAVGGWDFLWTKSQKAGRSDYSFLQLLRRHRSNVAYVLLPVLLQSLGYDEVDKSLEVTIATAAVSALQSPRILLLESTSMCTLANRGPTRYRTMCIQYYLPGAWSLEKTPPSTQEQVD